MKPNPAFTNLRFRQVHLDFHTSEDVPDIGKHFDKKQFQAALQIGCVDSINVFSKCHHGWSYHPTKVGKMHPNLDFDLFQAQLDACHEIDVKMPGYISAGFDEMYIKEFPGDIVMDANGYDPLNLGYKRLCFNTPYLDYFCDQVEEMVINYKVDGVWTDIVGISPCVCRRCEKELIERGMNPGNPEDVMALAVEVQRRFFNRVNQTIHKQKPDLLIFHNQGHIPKGDYDAMDAVTHLELESLPTGGWGYDHFPVSAKYSATQQKEALGMTGKFHTTWGEFGGFKHPNALRYECAAMIAYGARCAVGDQLHPNGIMNLDTYRRIGLAYEEVEAKQAYCKDAHPAADVAFLSIESISDARVMGAHIADRDIKADTGCSRILLEAQIMFDIIDTKSDFNKYKLLIIPDDGRMNETLAIKVQAFLKQGGKLVLSGESGMRPDKDTFYFDVGIALGKSQTDMEYVQLTSEFLATANDPEMVSCPFVINGDNWQIKPVAGAKEIAHIRRSYFNRDHRHFTSLQHAPDEEQSGYPAAFQTENILYFGPKIFTQYALRAQALYRDFVKHAIDQFMGGLPTVSSLPSAGRISLMQQAEASRYVFHTLYANPIKRGNAVLPRWGIHSIEVIEDILPIRDVACSLRIAEAIQYVQLAPSGKKIPFQQEADRITFTIPEVECHQMVTLNY